MSILVTVAPREIHDLAYRASRVRGCDAGTAERIAENVTYAEMHRGDALGAVCRALDDSDLLGSAWATAPDAVLEAELAARADGMASAAFDPAVPLAAISATLAQGLSRGVAPVSIDHHAPGYTPVAAVELRPVDDEVITASRARIMNAHREAHRLGVAVIRTHFNALEAAAAAFLVAESTLDLIG